MVSGQRFVDQTYYASLAIEFGICYYLGPRYGLRPTIGGVVGTIAIETIESLTGIYPIRMALDYLAASITNNTSSVAKPHRIYTQTGVAME